MTGRDEAIRAFLSASGWGGAVRAPLAGDASNRRYLRLTGPAGRAVLMDAPAERGEDVGPFLEITAHLRARGLSAPEVLAEDRAAGLVLLEDLGDALYARVLSAQPKAERGLYGAAVDLLAERAGAPPPLPPYGLPVLLAEARLATDWYLAGLGRTPTPGLAADYEALLAEALGPAQEARSAFVLRDYHAENLIWLPEREGHARVGLLDYQDALAGHPAYDLVSLLEDARRDTSAELRTAMVARYLAARPELDREAFGAAYAALGAQRNLKIVGIFARLCRRDGKPGYLRLIPRVWAHLMRDLEHPSLAALSAWVARHLPAPTPEALETIAAADTAAAGPA